MSATSRNSFSRVIRDPRHIEPNLNWASDLTEKLLPSGPVQISVGKPRRTDDHSARFHAMCGEVAKQAQFMGRKLTKDQWKVLFISGHAMATGLQADIVPGLEGEFVNIREKTSTMTSSRISSLIEYVSAWCAENDIRLREVGRNEE